LVSARVPFPVLKKNTSAKGTPANQFSEPATKGSSISPNESTQLEDATDSSLSTIKNHKEPINYQLQDITGLPVLNHGQINPKANDSKASSLKAKLIPESAEIKNNLEKTSTVSTDKSVEDEKSTPSKETSTIEQKTIKPEHHKTPFLVPLDSKQSPTLTQIEEPTQDPKEIEILANLEAITNKVKINNTSDPNIDFGDGANESIGQIYIDKEGLIHKVQPSNKIR